MAHSLAADTAHALRASLKLAGIRADVAVICNKRAIRVCTKRGARFTPAQIEAVCNEAIVLGLTGAAKLPIRPKHEALLTEKAEWWFWR